MKLDVKGLWYRYEAGGHDVLRDLSFTLEDNAFCAVLGPNGSGKTTLLRLMAGLLPQKDRLRGSVSFGDGATPLHRAVAYVPGHLLTAFPITVEEFVLQGRYAHSSPWSAPRSEDRRASAEALALVRLQAMAAVPLQHLSSGERQLCLLARALAQKPRWILLDEATSNLDLHYQVEAFKVMKDANNEGTGIVVVSHDLNIPLEFCKEALWLKNGEQVARGPLKETLDEALLRKLYPADELTVGSNPHTSCPKVFYKPYTL
jgi:iron complex transport system ATP-binding protein